jgi:hypothetical protein
MIFAEYDLYPSTIKEIFDEEARKYEVIVPNTSENTTKKRKLASCTSQYFEDAIFGAEDSQPDRSIASELIQYLGDRIERRDTIVLDFWKERANTYPGLANMAMHFLAIPATSCPSEGIFTKTKRILGPQRVSLAPRHVESTLCVKDWYRVFGPLFMAESAETGDQPHIVID